MSRTAEGNPPHSGAGTSAKGKTGKAAPGTPATSRPGRSKIPSFLPWLALLTLAYLLVETAFNARLLDVAGGMATAAEIESIERFGRLISGAAVALAVWGVVVLPWCLRRRVRPVVAAVLLATTGVTSVAGTYYGEKALIDGIVERSDAHSRQLAAMLSLMSHGIRHGHVDLDGLDIDVAGLQTPEGKSFVALFPMLAYSTENLVEKSAKVRNHLLRQAIMTRTGSREYLYNSAFVPSVKSLSASYNRYVDGVNRMVDELARKPQRADEAWNDYLEELRAKRISDPGKVRSPDTQARIRKGVQDKGIRVPNDWMPHDRITFQRAVADKVERAAKAEFRRVVTRELGEGATLTADLSWKQFAAHPAVQERWRKEIRAPKNARLDPGMSVEAFGRRVYEPKVDRAVAREAEQYEAELAEFADGGAHETFGRASMRAMVVPPIALVISLLGAMVHVFKLTAMVSIIAWPGINRLIRYPALGIAVGALTLSPLTVPNAVTQSRIFGYFERQTTENLGPASALAMTWVVQMQPYAYPLNEMSRKYVLGSYAFGYADREE